MSTLLVKMCSKRKGRGVEVSEAVTSYKYYFLSLNHITNSKMAIFVNIMTLVVHSFCNGYIEMPDAKQFKIST